MMIDKEYVRKILNQYADVAMEVSAIKREVIKEKDIENDEKWSWREQDTMKTFLSFGCSRLLDELIPMEQE